MASSADAGEINSYDITGLSSLADNLCSILTGRVVVRVTGLPRLLLSWSLRAYVRIEVADFTWITKGAQWKNGGDILCEEQITLRTVSPSENITLSLIRDHRINLFNKPSKATKASVVIKLADLLEQSGSVPHKATDFALKYKGEEACKLTLRISASSPPTTHSSSTTAASSPPAVVLNSTTVTLSSAMDTLAKAPAQLSESERTVVVANAMAAAGDTITDLAQSGLVDALTKLVNNLDFVVKLGDEIAKIHPWASLAWNVLSIGLKLVKAQQDRDNKITALIQTMQSTYSAVVHSEVVKDERLHDVLERILRQTVDCGFFIQQYARPRSYTGSWRDKGRRDCRSNFRIGKTITEVFTHTDALVAQYQSTFEQLLKEFHDRVATKTALMTVDIALELAKVAAMVKDIRLDQLLEKLKPAEMDRSTRKSCLPGTQLKSIKSVLDWYSDDSAESVMWLWGMAGAGKSTLSTTIARMMDSANGINLLGAFFFFDRNIAQRNTTTLIRTIAYQLARFDPALGARIQDVILKTPEIAEISLDDQFLKLLSREALGDIPWSRGPILIIIDALDESGAVEERERLLEVLSDGGSKLPHFMRLLILSRRERDIMDYYDHPTLRQEELKVDAEENRADITAFISSRLNHTRERNIKYLREALKDWPTESDVNALVDLASGHYIWAQTACRMIDIDDDPKNKLEDLIRHQPEVTSDGSFESLYQLYKIALNSAVHWNNRASCNRARDLLGAVTCAQEPLSCTAGDAIIGREVPFLQTVSRFGSVLDWTETGPIRIIHKSFHDYLTMHSTAEPWAISVNECNLQLANGCVALLTKELRENMCHLTLPQPVEDETLPEATSYAAKFWIEHVCLVTNPSKDLADTIERFMRIHMLHWMEALSIIKKHDVAASSLSKLLEYVQKHFPGSELYDFVQDADRFARYFARTIKEHPLLVYCSALPFTPHDTIIYKTFHHAGLPHVVAGVEPKWTTLLRVVYNHKAIVYSVALSPDGSRIALGLSGGGVQVSDTLTGQPALPLLEGHTESVLSVSFSPDGSKIVSGSFEGTVRVRDASTGQPALSPFRGNGPVLSVAFSPDGSRIVSESINNALQVWDALTGQPTLPPLEGHGDSVRSVSFSPDGSWIVSGSDDKTILVWDALTGRRTTLPPINSNRGVWSVSFSLDGSRIVAELNDSSVWVWDACTGRPQEDETCYTRSPCRMSDSPAQISVDEDRYFVDANSGLYLSKLPSAFPFNYVVVGHHHTNCILAKWTSGELQIPISITFPSR
ncbi:hypothetical protein HWV62_24970 [Athelia sp. TMB]|nr:hypothetical protein HWV62_24970 [Athelia sp. TMB]